MPLTPEQLRLKQLFGGNPAANLQLPQEQAAPEEEQPQYQETQPYASPQMAYTQQETTNPDAYQTAIANRFSGITDVGTQATNQALGAAQQKAAADYAARQTQANATAYTPGATYQGSPNPETGNARRDAVLNAARASLGLPYAWGGGTSKGASYGIGRGTSNLKGFDCSGLVLYAYSKIGIQTSHSANQQARMGVRMPINKLSPGDLVGKPGHIAIYAGNGMMYEAPTFGKNVRLVPVRSGMFGVHINI